MTKPLSAEDRYYAAAHAMQSGVAYSMEIDPGDTTPKHLRVGVNSAMVSQRALGDLLKAKGLITEDEYLESLAAAMEAEVALYEERLNAHYGTKVKLA